MNYSEYSDSYVDDYHNERVEYCPNCGTVNYDCLCIECEECLEYKDNDHNWRVIEVMGEEKKYYYCEDCHDEVSECECGDWVSFINEDEHKDCDKLFT
ncbi:hypothetical protein CL614_09660 [archaeon]|nr:hypothetical protein [archaeon]